MFVIVALLPAGALIMFCGCNILIEPIFRPQVRADLFRMRFVVLEINGNYLGASN